MLRFVVAAVLCFVAAGAAIADYLANPLQNYSPIYGLGTYRTPLPSAGIVVYVNGNSGSTATCGITGALTCQAGNDSTGNGTTSAPYLTLTKAIAVIYNLDVLGGGVTINLAHNTGTTNYSAGCAGGVLVGSITFNIVGDVTSPTSVKMLAPNSGIGLSTKDGCVPSISSFEIDDQGSSIGAISVGQFSMIDMRAIFFGSFNTSAAVMSVGGGGTINLLGVDPNPMSSGVTNTLNSTAYGIVFSMDSSGILNFNSRTVAIPNAITLGGGKSFISAYGGFLVGASSGTFTGAGVAGTTGSRCSWFNSISEGTDPNTIFPGNANCTPTNLTY